MKKKHFAGVLMLTAAVALGTVSPVALPNTAVVVKAEETYSFKSTGNEAYAGLTAKVLADGKIEISGVTSATLGNNHVFGIGDDETKAIDDALNKGAVIEFKEDKFVKEIPAGSKFIAIVKKMEYSNKAEIIGGKFDVTNFTQEAADGDVTNTANKGQATANKDLEYRKSGTEKWEKVENAKLFPATAVAEGTSEKYEFRLPAKEGVSGTGKLASKPKEITIVNKKPFAFEELKELTYTITASNELEFKGLNKEVFTATTRGGDGGQFAYEIVNAGGNVDTAPTTAGTLISEGGKTAALTAGQKVVVFAQADAKKAENKLVLEVKQAEKPKFKQSGTEYKLEADGYYKVDGRYEINRAAAGYKPAIVEGKMIVVDGPDTATTINYKVKDLGSVAGEIKFNNNKAEFKLPSAESEDIEVKKNSAKIGKTEFDAIKFNIVDSKKNVTITEFKDSVKNKTDKVKYTYGNKTGYLTADAKEDKVTLPVTTGKLTLEVEGNANFVKTIEFVSAGANDKQIEKKYTSPDDIWVALGGNVSAADGTEITTYKIREKDKTDKVTVKKPVYNKTAMYYISRTDADLVDANNILNNATSKVYKIDEEFEVYLQTEEDKKKQDKTLVKDAVVPVTGSTSGAKKEEPKKEEPKKEEPKKDDTKKEEPKKDDAKNTDNSSTTTDTKQPAQVDAKNTKSNSVSVSAEKIADALEGGLKVTGKSGVVKFAASAVKKVVGTEPVDVKVTLKTSVKKTTDKVVTKKLKGSKVLGGKVFALDLRVGNTAVKESKMKSTSVTVTLKANLGKAKKTVYVLDLSSGKRVKATYKNGKVTFKTKYLGRFVIVNKAK